MSDQHVSTLLNQQQQQQSQQQAPPLAVQGGAIDNLQCQWLDCNERAETPEHLYVSLTISNSSIYRCFHHIQLLIPSRTMSVTSTSVAKAPTISISSVTGDHVAPRLSNATTSPHTYASTYL